MKQAMKELVLAIAQGVPNDPDPNGLFWSWVYGTFDFFVIGGLRMMFRGPAAD